MNFLRTHITTILFIAIAIFLTLQMKSCFDKVHKPESMIRNEVEIENLQKQLPIITRERDSIRAAYDSLISLSVARFDELENKKQPIRNAINKIHTTVDNFDREQLRREFANGN